MEFTKIFLGFLFLLGAYIYQCYQRLSKNLPPPDFDINEYWGKGQLKDHKDDSAIKPFKLTFGDEVIEKLKYRLSDAGPFTDPLEDVAFEYGFNTKKIQKVVDYWRDDYLKNWKSRQDFLNKFPQFKTQVQGLNIHYLHVKPKLGADEKNVKIFPLLLIHGWPGSIREFYEILPLLTTPKDGIAFEVIAPSLPGFGFSDSAAKKGLGPEKMSVILRNLMIKIGHEKFYVQGGDWGSMVGGHLSALFPENVLGYHSNFMQISTGFQIFKTMIGSFYPSYFIEQERYISWMYPFTDTFKFLLEESGYFHLQATKPDTIGIALTSNPVGLAAYILEKFSTATDKNYRNLPDGGLENDFKMETLLDNVMIYYLSNSALTAGRIYKEAINKSYPMDRVAVTVPSGCVHFKDEIYHQFAFITTERYKNLIHETFYEHGGHFAALQVPKVLHEDIVKFVRKTLKKE